MRQIEISIMVSFNQLALYFGSFCLFEDVSFLINDKDRIGLVGRNGAGKTSLLKILTGEMAYDEGSVSMPGDLSIGYLPQQMKVSNTQSVFDETLHAFGDWLELKKSIEKLNRLLEEREDYESDSYFKLTSQWADHNERYQLLGGESLYANVEQTLLGLGFERKDFSKPTSELSGGWRMRIELAKILLKRPKLLLLDEPTNHLDIESIQWLEDFLKDYPGAVVLISHDRIFLDQVTNRTIEIIKGKIYDYKAAYSHFEVLRKERREQQLAAFKNQQKKIEVTEQFIDRFRYKSTKAVQVQSRIKQLDKIERIELDEIDQAKMHFRFAPAPHSGSQVLEIENLGKAYGDHQVLQGIGLRLKRGDKIAFVGKNGEGKSTLSKIIVGLLDFKGKCLHGHMVKIGYYAQNQDELLNEDKTVFEIIDDAAVGEVRKRTRELLGAFLFSGDSVDKKVKVLSGGERSRLAMARMLLEPVNLLVLDEPTNHLDMVSKDILKQALLNYDGTLIVVSHDRYFLDGLVEKVYEFRNRGIKEYLGGIMEFMRKKRIDHLNEIERNKQSASSNSQKKESDQKMQYQQRKELERELRRIKNRVEENEKRIGELENLLEELARLMSLPEKSQDETLFKSYGSAKKDLEEAMALWEILHEELHQKEEKKLSGF